MEALDKFEGTEAKVRTDSPRIPKAPRDYYGRPPFFDFSLSTDIRLFEPFTTADETLDL
jgi:hypothetical protein